MILLDFIKIDLSLALLLFLPGYSILVALTRNKNPLGLLGTLLVSIVLSLSSVNFGLILVDKLGLGLTPVNIIITVLLISAVALIIYGIRPEKENKKEKNTNENWLLFLLIMLFSVFLRIIYIIPKIIPRTTDLGHHMYWVNYIVKFQELPLYGIPDVIIGEHIIFGALAILSGIGIFTSLPTAILFLINILSLIAIFLLTREIAELIFKKESAYKIGIISLLAIGVFYAIASPQATYINGGVVGNLMGNLLIPTIFYLFVKAFKYKNPTLATFGILITGNLAYTHHLSSFIFAYSLVGFLLLFFALVLIVKFLFKKQIDLKPFIKTFFNLKTIGAGIMILVWFFAARIPSYLNPSAIDTAVGAPSKSTRIGLSINNLIHSTGPWRIFYSLIGIIFLSFLIWKIIQNKSAIKKLYETKKTDLINVLLGVSLAIAWFATIFLMSYRPDLLKIDIISGRIANYLTYPSAVLAAFGVYAVLKPVRQKGLVGLMVFALIFIPGIISGLFDVSENYPEEKDKNKMERTIQTFRGSKYLSNKTSEKQKILKDHIYLVGDTWVKNFLMRGYEEPLSRTYLRKYEDPVKPRETCTRDMIAIPDTEIGKKCFEKTGVKFIILKDGYDTIQFEKSNNFSKIFSTDEAVIFQKNE